MVEYRFISTRWIDGELKKVIVDICGDIINRDPTKEELKDLKKELPRRELYNNKDYLLEFLIYFDKKEGRAPKQLEFNNNPKYPSYVRYYSNFGSWDNAIRSAGLLAKREIARKRLYTNEELLESLRRFEREEGRSPEQLDFNNNPKYPSFNTYQRYFGSWNNALKLAGLCVNVFTNCRDEELLEFLIKFEIEEGRIPKQEDFVNNPNYPSPNLYKSRFGSWNDAIRYAGLIPGKYISDDELLEYLTRFKIEEGRIPKQEDFINNHRYPGFMTIIRQFGSWNNSLRLAGLVPNRYLTENELLEGLVRYEIDHGGPPTAKDLVNNHKYPGLCTYTGHFGSFENAKRLVGLDTDSMIRKGVIKSTIQKGRQAELYVLENYEKGSRDLSGENWKSPFDGISNKSEETYDVKSSKLHEDKFFLFNLNKCVNSYYLIGYDRNYKNVLYKWKIPGNFHYELLIIWLSNSYHYNIENMKKYEISDIQLVEEK